MLPVVDEFARECLTIEVERSLTARAVVETLTYLFETHGVPGHIRSDHGPEFTGRVVLAGGTASRLRGRTGGGESAIARGVRGRLVLKSHLPCRAAALGNS